MARGAGVTIPYYIHIIHTHPNFRHASLVCRFQAGGSQYSAIQQLEEEKMFTTPQPGNLRLTRLPIHRLERVGSR